MSMEALEPVWKALSDPTRRAILDSLREGPRTTGQLCDSFKRKMSRFGVMKHLKVLQEAGLVLVRTSGRERWNHLNAVPLRLVYERWVSRYAGRWAASLSGLKHTAEDERKQTMTQTTTMEETARMIHMEHEVRVEAAREKVWDGILDVDSWWAFRMTEGVRRVVLEPQVGGRFYEDCGDGCGRLWGQVLQIEGPGKLVLTGQLGLERPVSGVWIYTLEEDGSATIVKVSHKVVGVIKEGWEDDFNKGWPELLGKHLKTFAETGKRFDA